LSVGALLPVDTLSLYPNPGDDVTAVTDLYFVQFLSEWFGVMAGKMSPRDANVFASDETSQFMNTGFTFNPALATTLPLDFLAAGAILRPTDWFNIVTLVLDSEAPFANRVAISRMERNRTSNTRPRT
jgi:porin